MLVLTRKRSETIQIGEDIFIKVIRTGRTSVKIGIEAPANVRVVRGELLDGHDPTAAPDSELVLRPRPISLRRWSPARTSSRIRISPRASSGLSGICPSTRSTIA